MAMKPGTTTPPPRFNETTMAIVASLVLSIILATVVAGNPFRAMRLAYTDYRGTPAAGAPKASTTRAPETTSAPANKPSASDTKTNG